MKPIYHQDTEATEIKGREVALTAYYQINCQQGCLHDSHGLARVGQYEQHSLAYYNCSTILCWYLVYTYQTQNP